MKPRRERDINFWTLDYDVLVCFLWRGSAIENVFGHWIIYDKIWRMILSCNPLVRQCPQRHYSQWLGQSSHLVVEPLWHKPEFAIVLYYVDQRVS
jgi:hypothetical protein